MGALPTPQASKRVLATPEPKIVYGIAYRPQGRRTGEAQPPRRSVVSGNAGMMQFLRAFDLIELNGAHVTGLLWRQLRECLLAYQQ